MNTPRGGGLARRALDRMGRWRMYGRRIPDPTSDELERAASLLDRHFVVIGGLHRSGTTMLATMIGDQSHASTLTDTGRYADEGQHVQRVHEPASRFGGAGSFAFDARAPMVATDAGPDDGLRLVAYWSRYWDTSAEVLVEKSPINMIRFPYLQTVLPHTTCVLIRRHPVAVAYATQKWSKTSTRALLEHWIAAHDIYASHRPSLVDPVELTYEDVVADPAAALDGLTSRLGLGPLGTSVEVRAHVNERYFEMWRQDPTARGGQLRDLYPALRAHGYDLDDLDRPPT